MNVLDRIDFSNNWLTLVLLFLLLLIAILKSINQQKLFGYSRAFFLKGFIAKKTEERESFFNVFNLVLFFFSSIIFGVVISLFVQYFLDFKLSFMLFIKIYSLVLVYLFVFILLDRIIANLFEINNEVSYLLSSKIAYLYNTSLLLFPVLVIINYSFTSTFVLFWFLIGFLLLSILLLVVNNKNLIINKLFYFILYLCALEIAPLLIIYKITL